MADEPTAVTLTTRKLATPTVTAEWAADNVLGGYVWAGIACAAEMRLDALIMADAPPEPDAVVEGPA